MALFAHYAYWTLGWLGTEMLSRASVEPGLRRALELQIEGLGTGSENQKRRQ
jgi:hypothetical protein